MSERMNSILDVKDRNPFLLSKLKKPRILGTLVLLFVVLFCFYKIVIYLETHVTANPFLIMLFPFIGMFSLLSILPLVFFLSFEEDFRRVNPLYPPHYFFLLRKMFQALQGNQWKVTAKDL